MRALREGCLSVAKNAFERLKDIKYLSFIENIQREHENADFIVDCPIRLFGDTSMENVSIFACLNFF